MIDVLKAIARLINSAEKDAEGYWVLKVRFNFIDMAGNPVMNFTDLEPEA